MTIKANMDLIRARREIINILTQKRMSNKHKLEFAGKILFQLYKEHGNDYSDKVYQQFKTYFFILEQNRDGFTQFEDLSDESN